MKEIIGKMCTETGETGENGEPVKARAADANKDINPKTGSPYDPVGYALSAIGVSEDDINKGVD